ncbi:hypothetical protein COEREDRAFT_6830 [Coemansia reversa NRRL 1564]|uniref:HCNGP-domain-containing protein n=1 Tax=Coemansia reversa (strain ATCC 12441 / NRRL 1564) TaxID=763665 RepID=A0A2G5BGE1_COERN|nr:hypothetical protein COEREDRAFT_6830 [Coemansia reversa NRRL 1564]|eukprot:PIA18094.1 hypothetical protein COEREDRAFT_6830 [Coemansia reversa NRRL 1564]
MADASNALLNALGAYSSDDESGSGNEGNSPESSPSMKTEPALSALHHDDTTRPTTYTRSTESANDDKNVEGSDSEQQNGSASEQMGHTLYKGVDVKQLDDYVAIKDNLEKLLGCDQVPDIVVPAAASECPEELQAKFQQWYRLREQGANFNEALLRNKTFRNPNIYRWLVDHLQLEEAGSNIKPDGGFDPIQLRKDFTAKGLAEDQERRAREYAAKRAATTAGGTSRRPQFRSAGYETTQSTRRTGSRRITDSSVRRFHESNHTAATQSENTKSFEDAVQRAKLIAQHLSKTKRQ